MNENERRAHALGVTAAQNAASWVIDGNRSHEDYITIARLLHEDRVDEVQIYLPAYPNLSGEWDATRGTLICHVLDVSTVDEADPDDVDAVCDAWEQGVSETFLPECERLVFAQLSDAERAEVTK